MSIFFALSVEGAEKSSWVFASEFTFAPILLNQLWVCERLRSWPDLTATRRRREPASQFKFFFLFQNRHFMTKWNFKIQFGNMWICTACCFDSHYCKTEAFFHYLAPPCSCVSMWKGTKKSRRERIVHCTVRNSLPTRLTRYIIQIFLPLLKTLGKYNWKATMQLSYCYSLKQLCEHLFQVYYISCLLGYISGQFQTENDQFEFWNDHWVRPSADLSDWFWQLYPVLLFCTTWQPS